MKRLNKEQVSKVRTYFEMLDIVRGKKPNVTETDRELSYMVSMFNLVQKLGHGDPIAAAHAHKHIMEGVTNAIKLSNGNQSSEIH